MPPAQDRVQRVGHVAGGEHVGVGAGQPLVDQDAVVGRQPGGLGERDVRATPRCRPRPGRPPASRRRARRTTAPEPVFSMAGDLDARAQVDAVLGVQVGEDLGHLGAEHPQQRQVERLEDRDGGARLARGGRGLEADPAAADDHHPGAVGERLLEPLAVLDGAEVGDRGAGVVGDPQVPRRRPGRQQQLGVGLLPVAGADDVRGGVDRGDLLAEPQVDVVLVVPVGVVHERRLEVVVAQEVALGQRRSLVGQVVLVAVHHDGPLEPRGPQLLDGLGRGQPGSHDDEGLAHDRSWCTRRQVPAERTTQAGRRSPLRRAGSGTTTSTTPSTCSGTPSRPARRTVGSTASLSGSARQTSRR